MIFLMLNPRGKLDMLAISGCIIKRTRRTIKFSDTESAVKVTYHVVDENGTVSLVTHMSPEEPYKAAPDDTVSIPVEVNVFTTRRGIVSYELRVEGGSASEEEF